jgi:hypothetical protein
LGVLKARRAAFAAEIAKLDTEAELFRIAAVPFKRLIKEAISSLAAPKRLRIRGTTSRAAGLTLILAAPSSITTRAPPKNKGKRKVIDKKKAVALSAIIT